MAGCAGDFFRHYLSLDALVSKVLVLWPKEKTEQSPWSILGYLTD
ncbi:hypothetical protein SPWS13_2317 [Shewanella putrefaciens]|nr:hypothetical protein SPWS13_2317 [Shewanella putrefaciens]